MDIERKVWMKDENGVGSPENDISYSNRLGRMNLPFGQTKKQIKARSRMNARAFWDDRVKNSKVTKIQGLRLVQWLISESRYVEAKALLEKIKKEVALLQVQSEGRLSDAKNMLAEYKINHGR